MLLKKVVFGLVVVSVWLSCSGCITALGGIIGHQSGEMAAGLAIGAAVEFGGAIVGGIGGLIAGDGEPRLVAYTDEGYIRLKRGCDQKRILNRLQEQMRHNGWSCDGNREASYGHDLRSEMWHCVAAGGIEFDLEIIREKKQDTRIYVRMIQSRAEMRGMVTSQVTEWLRDSVGE